MVDYMCIRHHYDTIDVYYDNKPSQDDDDPD